MALPYAFVGTAILAFIAITAKFWWDLRDSVLKLDRSFRDGITGDKEEYWSRYIAVPMNQFFEMATELLDENPDDYENIGDILDHVDHGKALEKYFKAASEEYVTYNRLCNLITDLKSAQKNQRNWVSKSFLLLAGALIAITLDYLNQSSSDMIAGFSKSMLSLVFLSCFWILLALGTIAALLFYKQHSIEQALQAFYSGCQDKMDSRG